MSYRRCKSCNLLVDVRTYHDCDKPRMIIIQSVRELGEQYIGAHDGHILAVSPQVWETIKGVQSMPTGSFTFFGIIPGIFHSNGDTISNDPVEIRQTARSFEQFPTSTQWFEPTGVKLS